VAITTISRIKDITADQLSYALIGQQDKFSSSAVMALLFAIFRSGFLPPIGEYSV
jgi:hypothetical protein